MFRCCAFQIRSPYVTRIRDVGWEATLSPGKKAGSVPKTVAAVVTDPAVNGDLFDLLASDGG